VQSRCYGCSAAAMTIELEAKLVPSKGFQMPALQDALPGAVTVVQPVRELDAIYYDTPDLELARWGVTLRHRRGESGRPWTLKLPEHEAGALMARDELSFDGEIDAVPAEASDLVRAFTRGRALTGVARLHTSRVPVQIRDTDGRTLVEIVDDSVAVFEGARELEHFREVEVEAAVDSPRSRAVLQSAVSALVSAGCRTEKPLPKLVRALGRRAQEPPSVVVVPVGPQTSTADLIRYVTAASVRQILLHDAGVRLGEDPEAVHQYRVATRRLRSDLRTFSGFLDAGRTDELRGELSWLGSVVGPVRDLDVLGTRFAAQIRGLPDLDQPAASGLLTQLAASRLAARQGLLEALRSQRYDRVLRALVAVASTPPVVPGRKATRSAATAASRLVRRRWTQLDAAVEAAGKDPTDEELHLIRIAAKRCRYAAEAVTPVVGPRAARFAAGIQDVQTVLGDYHDTVVAENWLRDTAIGQVDAGIAVGGLIASERQERAGLRAAWPATWQLASRPKNRSWLTQ
jgi:CHAD domain-containing protein